MSAELTDVRAARDMLRFEITVDSGDPDVHGWALEHAWDLIDLAGLAGVPLPDWVRASYGAPHAQDWDDLTDHASGDLLAAAWDRVVDDCGPDAADEALRYWSRVLTRYLQLPAVAALAGEG